MLYLLLLYYIIISIVSQILQCLRKTCLAASTDKKGYVNRLKTVLVNEERVELSTPWLKVACSANWATHSGSGLKLTSCTSFPYMAFSSFAIWCQWQKGWDSNPRRLVTSPVFKTGAIDQLYHPSIEAGATRSTSSLPADVCACLCNRHNNGYT